MSAAPVAPLESTAKSEPADAAKDAPDEAVERMTGALSLAQREDLRKELEVECAALKRKNAALRVKVAEVEQAMIEGITSREAVIKGESETTARMGEEASTAEARMRLEADGLAAALAARTALKAASLAESSGKVSTLRVKLDDLRDFRRDHDRLNEELSDVKTRQDAYDAQFCKRVAKMEATMEANAVRWAAEMKARSDAARSNLQDKVEREVFTQFHTIQSEHARMRTELGYQQHRMSLIAAANDCVLRRTRDLDVKVARERELRGVVSRCIEYHKRIIDRNRRGSSASLLSGDSRRSGILAGDASSPDDASGSISFADDFAPPEEGDDLSLGSSFKSRSPRKQPKPIAPPPQGRRSRHFLGFSPRRATFVDVEHEQRAGYGTSGHSPTHSTPRAAPPPSDFEPQVLDIATPRLPTRPSR